MSILSILMGSSRNEPSSAPRDDCPLCTSEGGQLIWRGAFWRVVSIDDPHNPGYVRLILNRHCAEFTELAKPEQQQFFKLMIAIETLMRDTLAPEKINIASLGNYTPHQHWHFIPRWSDDAFFPDSIWSAAHREMSQQVRATRDAQATLLFAELPKVCAKAIY